MKKWKDLDAHDRHMVKHVALEVLGAFGFILMICAFVKTCSHLTSSSEKRNAEIEKQESESGFVIESHVIVEGQIVEVLHDTKHAVTCWRGYGMSGCLPDRDVKR